MHRRQLLIASAAAAAAAPLAACNAAEVKTFANFASAMRSIEALASGHKHSGAWTLAQILNHAAQSIDDSIDGFPEMKSALFRLAIGNAAFAVFQARGQMSHSLIEPIPGAPMLDAQAAIEPAIVRALAALRRFDAHNGALAPHFAYGLLDKRQYTRAHLMHLANHWSEIERS